MLSVARHSTYENDLPTSYWDTGKRNDAPSWIDAMKFELE